MVEYMVDIPHHRLTYALVCHVDNVGHLLWWSQASILQKGIEDRTIKVLKAAYIITQPNINSKAGSFTKARTAEQIMTHNW